MEYNYFVILFKNKLKKRIIKKFISLEKAKSFYQQLKKESSDVIFDKSFENGKECKYEIGLVKRGKELTEQIYLKDEFGRNVKTKLEDTEMSLVEVSIYRKEEKIFDIQKNIKITSDDFIKRYLGGQSVKMISSIHNKVVVQDNDIIFLFSLKNENESLRFLDSLQNFLFKIKKTNCIIVKDTSTPQKKYLIDILSKSGIDKKIIYRKFTTYPRS